MKHLFLSLCLTTVVSIFGVLPAVALGQSDPNVINGGGLVWFAGSVISDSDEAIRIDLGDVHGVLEGDRLAAFRPQNSHYAPLGTIQILESHSTWSRPARSISMALHKGDIIIGIRTLRQIGTGQDLQEAFLERQLVRSSNRNSYSTLREQQSAKILHGLVRRQTRWIRELKPVAGQIRSDSFSSENFQKIQPLLNQIMRFQDLRATGIPIERCIGKEWESVLGTLTPESAIAASTPGKGKLDQTPAVVSQSAESETDSLKSELEKRIDVVREETGLVLFDRFPEERNVAIMICSVIDLESPKNEPLWISLELSKSQFPELAEDREMLVELPEILKRVRTRVNP
ncbi:MAG: hypothetical protein WCK86_02790 [Planctomycetia bacterium]